MKLHVRFAPLPHDMTRLPLRLALLTPDSFNYGQMSDRFTVDSQHKSKSGSMGLGTGSLEGKDTDSHSFLFCPRAYNFSITALTSDFHNEEGGREAFKV